MGFHPSAPPWILPISIMQIVCMLFIVSFFVPPTDPPPNLIAEHYRRPYGIKCIWHWLRYEIIVVCCDWDWFCVGRLEPWRAYHSDPHFLRVQKHSPPTIPDPIAFLADHFRFRRPRAADHSDPHFPKWSPDHSDPHFW